MPHRTRARSTPAPPPSTPQQIIKDVFGGLYVPTTELVLGRKRQLRPTLRLKLLPMTWRDRSSLVYALESAIELATLGAEQWQLRVAHDREQIAVMVELAIGSPDEAARALTILDRIVAGIRSTP